MDLPLSSDSLSLLPGGGWIAVSNHLTRAGEFHDRPPLCGSRSQEECSAAVGAREASDDPLHIVVRALWRLCVRQVGADGAELRAGGGGADGGEMRSAEESPPHVRVLAAGERPSILRRASPDPAGTLFVAAEDLRRPPADLLAVLLHGLVHVANARAGVRDCSATHYHNLKFRRLAEAVGLWVPSSHARLGWATTVATTGLMQRFGPLIETLTSTPLPSPAVPPVPPIEPRVVPAPSEPPPAPPVLPPVSTELPAEIVLPPAPPPPGPKHWLCGSNLHREPWKARPVETVELPPPPCLPRYRLALVRDNEGPFDRYPRLDRPSRAAALLWQLLRHYDREALVVLYLDSRRRLIGYDIPSVGTLQHTAAEPRVVLAPALALNAAGVLVGHNHLSGDPRPSARDLQASHRLFQAGELLGVRLFDSLIVADQGRWCSCLL